MAVVGSAGSNANATTFPILGNVRNEKRYRGAAFHVQQPAAQLLTLPLTSKLTLTLVTIISIALLLTTSPFPTTPISIPIPFLFLFHFQTTR